MILRHFPPMGVYETLFKFSDSTGKYMGDEGTHPWAQGYPLTTQLPGGPPFPRSIGITATDRRYPKASGEPALVNAIADYYQHFYGARISTDNVAVFAGGRPAIFATLAFLLDGTTIALEATEYTPYYDILNVLRRPVSIIPSDESNAFRPKLTDYYVAPLPGTARVFLVKSNPCNPTGVTLGGDALHDLLRKYSGDNRGMLIDEAYEFFQDPEPDSAMRYILNIDDTNLFVIGAATKGLQVPGMRIGWVVASRKHIEIFRNYSSFGMGGVSRASQLYVTKLLKRKRVVQARNAVSKYYAAQRQRYRDGLARVGLQLFTGDGGFYHWLKLPDGLTGDGLNDRLFEYQAGVLPGHLCDMTRTADTDSALQGFARFSFGPLPMKSYDSDIEILRRCIDAAYGQQHTAGALGRA